ncbi:MAG: hypothetical protein A4S17_09155 [Proteobacteria bacterium HN_bin10]|nr:MAG: hypothetical protein A4S17_09155 [Proteobacteria bacterium HN_bin10]
MCHISTSIDIEASASRVWAVLMDFPAYSDWNPFVRSLEGSAEPGGRLQVTVQPEGGHMMSFTPEILACVPEREFRWCGTVMMERLFAGEHAFRLTESAAHSCRFIHEECFSGILVPILMRGAMRTGTQVGFVAMNRALKARAETLHLLRERRLIGDP